MPALVISLINFVMAPKYTIYLLLSSVGHHSSSKKHKSRDKDRDGHHRSSSSSKHGDKHSSSKHSSSKSKYINSPTLKVAIILALVRSPRHILTLLMQHEVYPRSAAPIILQEKQNSLYK